jgi:hypothetical protein
MRASGNYKPTKWDESTIEDISSDMKIVKVTAIFTFEGGEIEGEAAVEYLMFYAHTDKADEHNSIATYVGLMRMKGTLNGSAGSFVMADKGTYKQGVLNSTLAIIPDSGTNALAGITGSAKYYSNGDVVTMEIEYER